MLRTTPNTETRSTEQLQRTIRKNEPIWSKIGGRQLERYRSDHNALFYTEKFSLLPEPIITSITRIVHQVKDNSSFHHLRFSNQPSPLFPEE